MSNPILPLIPFMLVYGFYTTILGVLILSFPSSKLSQYHNYLNFKAISISSYGARKLILGMIALGFGLFFWISVRKESTDIYSLCIATGVSLTVFSFLFLFNLLTAHRMSFAPPANLEGAALLYEPYTVYLGCENAKAKESKYNGKLMLTKELILFQSTKHKAEISISIPKIQWIRVTPSHGKWTRSCPILQVAYTADNQEQKIAGFAAGNASEWAETIEWVGKEIGHKIEVISKKLEMKEMRHFRLRIYTSVFLTTLFLAVIIGIFLHLKK